MRVHSIKCGGYRKHQDRLYLGEIRLVTLQFTQTFLPSGLTWFSVRLIVKTMKNGNNFFQTKNILFLKIQ